VNRFLYKLKGCTRSYYMICHACSICDSKVKMFRDWLEHGAFFTSSVTTTTAHCEVLPFQSASTKGGDTFDARKIGALYT